MEPDVILAVKYLQDCKIVPVYSHSSFFEFGHQVFSMWSELHSGNSSFRYSVGSISNCVLQSDVDLSNMISLCKHTDQKLVSVVVNISVLDVVKSSQASKPSHYNASLSGSANSVNNLVPSDLLVTLADAPCDQASRISKTIPQYFRTVKNRFLDGQSEEFSGLGTLPKYSISPAIEKKPLLSDSWVDIFSDGVGTVFEGGKDEFRYALIRHSTVMRYNFKYIVNNKHYIHVECKSKITDGCQWFIKASMRPVTHICRVYKANFIHTCLGRVNNNNSRRFSPKVIGKLVHGDVRSHPDFSGKDVLDHMMDNYGIDIPYYKAWRTSETAKDHLFGRYEDSYDHLRWYCAAVRLTNPGSVVDLEHCPETGHFERIFVAFKACLDGFRHCRPMLFIDGTFLVGRAKGILLTATAKDGNNGLFPVAIAVVSSENTPNWVWFLSKLRDSCVHPKPICYLSDRNCGLMSAFPLVFDHPIHYFCLFHLLANLRSRFAGRNTNGLRSKMCEFFKDCAYAPNVCIFEQKLAKFLEAGGSRAAQFLEGLSYEKWAVAFSPEISRYGEMTSNAAESYNSFLKDARGLPITHMIDYIRTEISRWHLERRTKSTMWKSSLVPIKHTHWYLELDFTRSWKITQTPGGAFSVASTPSVTVILDQKYCSCCLWRVTGFPCKHAIAVITKTGLPFSNFVDDFYFTSTYQKCYMYDIHPVPETMKFELQFPHQDHKILPPLLKRFPGRPKKN